MPFSSVDSGAGCLTPEPVVISGPSARERGIERGRLLAVRIARTCADYAGLFAASGISADDAREAGLECHEATRREAPEVADEIEGIAQGARIDLWHLCIVIARTEILSLAEGGRGPERGECSTVIFAGSEGVMGAQTWDWHVEFRYHWHVHEVAALPGGYGYAGLTEFGMPGKIGLNSAGLGCFLNIMRHSDDQPGAVPIHAVLPAILNRAATRQEALELIRAARPQASSALTLVDHSGATMVEVSPGGVTTREVKGFAVHTNHFLDAEQQAGASALPYDDDSEPRYELLRTRIEAHKAPRETRDLVALLRSSGDEPAISKRADLTKPFGTRVATLATVAMHVEQNRVGVERGSPMEFAPEEMVLISPPTS